MSWCCYINTKYVIKNFSAFCYSLTPTVQPLDEKNFLLDMGNSDPRNTIATIYSQHGVAIHRLSMSHSKFLAQAVCLLPVSQIHSLKNQGLTVVAPRALLVRQGCEKEVTVKLPLSLLWSISPRTIDRLHSLGLSTLGDLNQFSLHTLTARFGEEGVQLYLYSRAEDREKIKAAYPPPQVTWTETLSDTAAAADISIPVSRAAENLAAVLEKHDFACKEITLTLTSDTEQHSYSRQFTRPKQSRHSLTAAGASLLRRQPTLEPKQITLTASGLLPPERQQLDLFNCFAVGQGEKYSQLDKVYTNLSSIYSAGTVKWGKDLLVSRREQFLIFWDPLRSGYREFKDA